MDQTTSRAVAKWGRAGMAGWQIVPDLLLKHQATLGLSHVEMLVLLNIAMHWWYPDQRPFPRSSAIARRMGVAVRTIQRAMDRLGDLGLIRKVKETSSDGLVREVCDLGGLVGRLDSIAENDSDYLVRSRQLRGGTNGIVSA